MEQAKDPVGSGAVRPVNDEQAFAEIALIARRLNRIERAARVAIDSVTRHADAWRSVSKHCAAALGSLALAAEALPDAEWRGDSGERLIAVRELSVDPVARQAWLGQREVPLARQEFNLLTTLASDPCKAWTKEELLERVWGFQARGRTRTVDTHASRVRLKLMDAGAASGEFVVSVWGVGYSLIRP